MPDPRRLAALLLAALLAPLLAAPAAHAAVQWTDDGLSKAVHP